jgi:hypothetical protein
MHRVWGLQVTDQWIESAAGQSLWKKKWHIQVNSSKNTMDEAL